MIPVTPPPHVLFTNHAFLDWFMYQLPWQSDIITGSLGSCPMCGAAVSFDWIPRQVHALWHASFYFEEA